MDMKTYVTYSLTKSGSFYCEGSDWHDLRQNALGYYGVQHLFYKEIRTDDFFIDSMLALVGSIKLSLHPNSQPVLIIKVKETHSFKNAYQLNVQFDQRQINRGVA